MLCVSSTPALTFSTGTTQALRPYCFSVGETGIFHPKKVPSPQNAGNQPINLK